MLAGAEDKTPKKPGTHGGGCLQRRLNRRPSPSDNLNRDVRQSSELP
ncbi:MAG: hypothetical protein JWP38_159 [Herbaspirillum sp.]|jgi:hypothetical protein|nr:hypothetical protein [Herbaspirillum sp.]